MQRFPQFSHAFIDHDLRLLNSFCRFLAHIITPQCEKSKKKNVPWWFIFFLTLYRFGANLPPNNKAPAH